MLERSFTFSFMTLMYLPLACIYFWWMWIDLHETHIDQSGYRSRTVIYCVYTIISLWSFATFPLLAFGSAWFSDTQSLILLSVTGLICCISGWWLFGWWVMGRPVSARGFSRFRSLRQPLHICLFGCLISAFSLVALLSPPFRLMIANIYIFGIYAGSALSIPLVIISALTTVFLSKFIEARANNKVKE